MRGPLAVATHRSRTQQASVQPPAGESRADSVRFAGLLDHVGRLADPFIDDAGFAGPAKLLLSPTLEQVLAKFEIMRKLLVLRLRVYGPSSHNYLAERCPDRLRLSVLRTWTDCRGGVRFGDPGRGTGRDSGRGKRTGKKRHVWPKNP